MVTASGITIITIARKGEGAHVRPSQAACAARHYGRRVAVPAGLVSPPASHGPKLAIVSIAFATILLAGPACAAEPVTADAPRAAEEVHGGHGMRTGLAVGSGCVGGAVLGTVVPIFGNLVGCAVGGFVGWWFGRDRGEVLSSVDRAAP